MRIFLIIFFSFNIVQAGIAEVKINSFLKNHSWKPEWSHVIDEELKRDDYSLGAESMLNLVIDEEDLDDLECDGYNQASFEDKRNFWIVFFSALARAESAFNPKVGSRKTHGHRSFGLLQLSKQTAKNECHFITPKQSVLNAEDNLRCGVKLMSWQLHGAPTKSGKKLRSDLEGQLFGKYIFQWGPLRQNDPKGRSLLVNWFKDHLEQLPFCKVKRSL